LHKLPRFAAAALATVALTTTTVPAEAQAGPAHFGPHVTYNFDSEKTALGPQLSIPIARHLEFYPSFDWFFVDNGSLWAMNIDLKYRVEGENAGWLYLGGGLNLSRSNPDQGNSSSDSRANLFAGIQSMRGNIHPFVELRALLGSGSSAQMMAGLNFTLGSR